MRSSTLLIAVAVGIVAMGCKPPTPIEAPLHRIEQPIYHASDLKDVPSGPDEKRVAGDWKFDTNSFRVTSAQVPGDDDKLNRLKQQLGGAVVTFNLDDTLVTKLPGGTLTGRYTISGDTVNVQLGQIATAYDPGRISSDGNRITIQSNNQGTPTEFDLVRA